MLQCAHDLATVDHEIEKNGMARNKVENEMLSWDDQIISFSLNQDIARMVDNFLMLCLDGGKVCASTNKQACFNQKQEMNIIGSLENVPYVSMLLSIYSWSSNPWTHNHEESERKNEEGMTWDVKMIIF